MPYEYETSSWCQTNNYWVPEGVATRWYISDPTLPVDGDIRYDIILTHEDGYWLVGASDKGCTGERVGPYATLEQAQAAAEMLATIGV